MAVAVAFAGAWVAIRIAFASHENVKNQAQREAYTSYIELTEKALTPLIAFKTALEQVFIYIDSIKIQNPALINDRDKIIQKFY